MRTIAVIGAGAMGSGVGRRLVERGMRVLTPLEGRSAATRQRAEGAGMEPVAYDRLSEASLVLSIVPPGEARAVAERAAAALAYKDEKPGYADCNAVSPETVVAIGALFAPIGVDFVDAGIIGGPPSPGKPGPLFYASGPAAGRLDTLSHFGLRVTVLDQPVGAASALKMAYAGMTKGFTALSAMMLLAASRAGVEKALHAELAASQPALLEIVTRAIPAMCPKAYRWVAEMEEIGGFASADANALRTYEGIAGFYRHMSEDVAGSGLDENRLKALLAMRPAP